MKKLASSLFVMGVVLLLSSSCFLDVTPSETATIRLVIEKSASDDYEDDRSFDCYAINVVGPGIRSFDSRYPVPNAKAIAEPSNYCHYPGIGSNLVQPGTATESNLEVGVPIGNPRLVQVIGMNLKSPATQCPQINMSELWKQKIDAATNVSEIDNANMVEVGRVVLDLPPGTREKSITIPVVATSNHFGKGYCDPPGTTGNSFSFSHLVTSIKATRVLATYVNPLGAAGAPYTFDFHGITWSTITTILASDIWSFGSLEESITVNVSDGTHSTMGTIDVQGFGKGTGSPDSSLFYWTSPDAYSGSTWGALSSSPITPSGLLSIPNFGNISVLPSGPNGYNYIRLLPGDPNALPPIASAHFPASFTMTPSPASDLTIFLVTKVNPGDVGDLVCLAASPVSKCTEVSTATSFFKIAMASAIGMLPDRFESTSCIGCDSIPTVPHVVNYAPIPANSAFTFLAARINGTQLITSVWDGAQTTNDSKNQSGAITLGTSYFSIGDSVHSQPVDIAEVLIYLKTAGAATVAVPCNYFNAKYNAHLDCNYLVNGH